jgi:hypothetical protein
MQQGKLAAVLREVVDVIVPLERGQQREEPEEGDERKEAGPRRRGPARAGNRRFWCLSALRAHTKAPYKTDLHRKTLRELKRPGGPGQRDLARHEGQVLDMHGPVRVVGDGEAARALGARPRAGDLVLRGCHPGSLHPGRSVLRSILAAAS